METNISRVSFEIGDVQEEAFKSEINLKVNFGKAAADAQIQKLNGALTGVNPNLSLIIVFTPVPGKVQELQELLETLLAGKSDLHIADDLVSLVQNGTVAYDFLEIGDHLILQLKPGEATEELVSGLLEKFESTSGLKNLAATEKADLSLSIASGIDFYDLLEFHNSGYSTAAALFQSLQVKLLAKAVKGSKFDKKFLGVLKNLLPFITKTPLPLLELLEYVDVDVALRSLEDAPFYVKKMLFGGEKFVQFPRPSKEIVGGDIQFLKKLTEVLASKASVFATLDKVAAVELTINLPGFGVCVVASKP